jgi:hypothetical protein
MTFADIRRFFVRASGVLAHFGCKWAGPAIMVPAVRGRGGMVDARDLKAFRYTYACSKTY